MEREEGMKRREKESKSLKNGKNKFILKNDVASDVKNIR